MWAYAIVCAMVMEGKGASEHVFILKILISACMFYYYLYVCVCVGVWVRNDLNLNSRDTGNGFAEASVK